MLYITKGAITGCCSATVLLPSEVVKAKTQVVVGNMESSSSDVYRKMMQRQGVRVRRYYLMHVFIFEPLLIASHNIRFGLIA
jgi:hypothetical protein